LTDSEKASLEFTRKAGFWSQPKALRITIVVLSIAAVIQGWVQTGLNGANPHWPSNLHVTEGDQIPQTPRQVWIYSGVNAAMYFSASLFGCWVSDPVQSLILGRRGAIILSACLCIAGAIGSACSRTWPQLLGCRVVLGAAMGAKAAVTPIFGAEVSPKHLRGALVMNWQLFVALGVFLGFTANLIFSHSGPPSWRYQLASASLPAVCLLSLVWTIPESPRWLLKKGRYSDAFASLVALRPTPLQAAAELFYANAQIQVEVRLPHGRSKVTELNRTALFCVSRIRRATVAALVIHIAQQLCGINVLQFYSSTFFQDPTAISQPVRGLWFSWGLGLANFIFTFPIYYFIDKRGRRFLLLASYPGMIISLLAASLSYNIDDSGQRLAVVIFWMFAFVFFYSWGQGPVPFAYSSEIFPLLNREAGMSFSVFVNLTGAGVLALVVPRLTQVLSDDSSTHYNPNDYNVGQSRLLAVFTGLNVLALILIFFFVPETAGASLGLDESNTLRYISLEELNWIFSVRTRKHIDYQLRYMIPWAWKILIWKWRHYVLRKREETRPDDPEEPYIWVVNEQIEELNEEREEGAAESGISHKASASERNERVLDDRHASS
ncbi:general substrate transporter, partial [Rhizodiscina lignyota]